MVIPYRYNIVDIVDIDTKTVSKNIKKKLTDLFEKPWFDIDTISSQTNSRKCNMLNHAKSFTELFYHDVLQPYAILIPYRHEGNLSNCQHKFLNDKDSISIQHYRYRRYRQEGKISTQTMNKSTICNTG